MKTHNPVPILRNIAVKPKVILPKTLIKSPQQMMSTAASKVVTIQKPDSASSRSSNVLTTSTQIVQTNSNKVVSDQPNNFVKISEKPRNKDENGIFRNKKVDSTTKLVTFIYTSHTRTCKCNWGAVNNKRSYIFK